MFMVSLQVSTETIERFVRRQEGAEFFGASLRARRSRKRPENPRVYRVQGNRLILQSIHWIKSQLAQSAPWDL